jgi:hypothetical protein
MYSTRTRISLAQFLDLQDQGFSALLLDKYDIGGLGVRYTTEVLQELVSALQSAAEGPMGSLLDELVRTQGDLRNRVSPRYRYDERLRDLQACLMLDGYLLTDRGLVPLDPSIVEEPPVEDDLTRELNASGLSCARAVIQKLEDSAAAFRASPPNVNSCLNDARIALQTLATDIARVRSPSHPGSFDPTKWGSVIAYFRSTGFITDEEEKGLVGVFGFVSPGSHRPLGLSDGEFARLGRSFVAGMCWFLVKRYRTVP